MRLIKILFLIINCFSILAQPALNKAYGTETGNSGYTVIPEQNGYFIAADGFSEQFNNWAAIKLYRVDSLGNVLWEKEYGRTSYVYEVTEGGSCKGTKDGGYLLPGNFSDSSESLFSGIIMRLDGDGNILWTDTFTLGSFTLFNDAIIAPDGGFVAVGQTSGLGDTSGNVYLVKVDSLGNFLWQKKYGGDGENDGYRIGLMADGGFILSGFTYSFGPGIINNYLIRTDSEGNVIWSRTYGASGQNGACLAYPARDGGFIMFGNWDTINPGLGSAYVAKLDNEGNIKWINFFSDTNYLDIDQIREIENGDIIVASDKIKPAGEQYFDEAAVAKLDSNGNELWEKLLLYNGPGPYPADTPYVSGNFYDFQSTRDSGFVYTGIATYNTTPTTQINEIWLVKTDSVACICNDTTGVEEIKIDNVSQFAVYPNPAGNQLVVEYNFDDTSGHNNQFELYDLLGSQLLLQTLSSNSGKDILDISNILNGFYLYDFKQQNTVVKSGKLSVIK